MRASPFGILSLLVHAAVVGAAACSFKRAVYGDGLSGMLYLLLAGACMFFDMLVVAGSLQKLTSTALASRPLRWLFGWTTLFGGVVGTLVGLTSLGVLLPLPWSRSFGALGLFNDLGGTLTALVSLVTLVGGYAWMSFWVAGLMLFSSEARRRNSSLLRVSSGDDAFDSSWRMPPKRCTSHETFAHQTNPEERLASSAPPAPPASPVVVPEESEDERAADRARDARRIVGVLETSRADAQEVIHALEAAERLAWKVPGYLQFELRRAIVALTEDSRSMEQGDPREGMPPITVGERALSCLRQWPGSELP